ncbi:hypothetical protein ACOSQ3_013468 [Xanthoceras sorbifolium]
MKDCSDVFCDISRQQVSFPKSRIYCSNNTKVDFATRIAKVYGFLLTNNLGNYLRVSLIHGRINNITYHELITKTKKRLASWKCASLSLAGRATLIRPITSALPIYAIQSIKIPSEVCKQLDRINKNFLWGHSVDKKSAHLVNWDSVGIWATLLRNKYLKNRNLVAANYKLKGTASSTCRAIVFGANLLNKGLRWRIGGGDKVRFWEDLWVPNCGYLKDYVCISLSSSEFLERVSDYIINGGWNLSKLGEVLPWSLIHRVANVYVSSNNLMVDIMIWELTQNDDFSVNSAYVN